MRSLRSYDYRAIAWHAGRRVVQPCVVVPYLYCRDVLSWKTRHWIREFRSGVCVALTALLVVLSIPALLLEGLINLLDPSGS